MMTAWDLDPSDGSLRSERGSTTLTPRAAQVLECLINRAGTVVSRETILNDVWSGLNVSPDLVRENVFEIRKALGDDAASPTFVETVGRRGYRLIGPISLRELERGVASPEKPKSNSHAGRPSHMPTVKYCRSNDGASIAHASSGEGYPLLFSGSWMTHLEMDWDSPAYGDYIRHLSDRFQVIRYDQRGNGLSQWSDMVLDFEHMVDDMEAVVDAYGYEKVAILGLSQGASVSIAYAIRHPERVSHLVLNGGYARGRKQRGNEEAREESEALVNLIRINWGNENPVARQILTSLFMPEASRDQMRWFNDFQKICGPAENMALFRALFDDINVGAFLPKVRTPTLVVHSNGDAVAPLSEGKILASQIEGASFVQLQSPNHLLFASEPDFQRMVESIETFINQ